MGTQLSLPELAARRLHSGSSHRLDLAQNVFRFRGNPGVASKAVFALLERDPRSCGDQEGYWSLIPGLKSPGISLTRFSFAVVDVDTMGSHGGQGDRAFGDALATAQLLLHLLKEAEAQGISDLIFLRVALGGERIRYRGRRRIQSREYDP